MIDKTQPLEEPKTWDYDSPLLPDLTVFDHVPTYHAVLDQDGEELSTPPRPIGFVDLANYRK